MFWRILRRLLRSNPARMATVLLALGAGAAVTAALLNLKVDAERRLTTEFRSFGANVVVSPRAGTADNVETIDEGLLNRVPLEFESAPVSAVPFLYFVAGVSKSGEARPQTVTAVVAGTNLSGLSLVGPGWRFDPVVPLKSEGAACLVGARVAAQFDAHPGEILTLRSAGKGEKCRIGASVSAGGTEDNQVFVELPMAQRLATQPGRISLIQVSVAGTPLRIEAFIARLSGALPEANVRGVRQFSDAEAHLYGRIRGLLTATVALILVLTGLCVMAAMTNAAMERKHDVGLMKAIGGPVARVLRLFLAEAAILGVVGGILGAAAGIALSIWLGKAVFGVAAQPRLIVYPVTVVLTVLVAIAGAFPLRRLAGVKPAVIFRGEA